MKKIIVLLLCCTLISACSDDKRYAPKEGRLAIFDAEPVQKATGHITLAKTTSIKEWTHSFQNQQNKLPNINATLTEKPLWQERISKAKKQKGRALPTPVLLADSIYMLDSAYTLTKLNSENGSQIWQKNLADNKQGFSLAYANKRFFALSTDGLLTAMDEEGEQLWQKDLATATRAQLIADSKSVYIITAQNQLITLNAKNGNELWRYQTAKPQTWLTSMAPPAKSENIIVAPFATGEVMAFDADSGLLLWIQMMIGNRPKDLIAVPQIVAAPVIDEDTVYLTGNANLSGAYDLKTGRTKWTIAEGSMITPVVSGNTLFMLTNENQLMALDKKSGKLFWQKEFKPEDNMLWQELLMLNDELVLVNGKQWFFIDAQNGETRQIQKWPSATQPVISNQHLLLIDDKMKATYF